MLGRLYRKLFIGEVKIRRHKLPKAVISGLLGVIFLYVSVAGMVSVATPWLTRGDTARHIDYVWRVHHGDIPRWSDGIKYPPLAKLTYNKNQGVSANPPLFYLIQAPIIGPSLDKGKWHQAIAIGRFVNIGFGVLCAVALGWAGWLFGQQRRALFAVAVPAMGVMMYHFTRLNVDFALDALLVLWATLSLIFDYKILQFGLHRRYVAILAVISVLGMLTKAPYVLFLLLSLGSLIVGSHLHGKDRGLRRWAPGGLAALATLVLTMMATGWYYYFRNYKAYGSWFSQSPASYTGGRSYKSIHYVLTSNKLWSLWYADFISRPLLSVMTSTLALAGWLGLSRKAIQEYFRDKARIASLGLLSLTVLGVFAIQFKFAIGYGSINFRYMLPALLPISLFLSFGLLSYRWLRGQLLAIIVLAMGLTSLQRIAGNIHKLHAATLANGVPDWIMVSLLLLFPIGAALFCWSLFRLSGRAARQG